jgi:ATP/maltotriose-dependent transcriptional regulator MalT
MGEGFPNESTFVGRSAELTTIAACVRSAVAGRASIVWIEGDAGTGKTALIRQTVASLAGGFTVMRAEADELAKDVSFAVVSQFGPINTVGAFAAGLELLQTWSAQQDTGPIMVIVEDLHWADPVSRQALVTAARRLGEDHVVMLVTTRPGAPLDDGWDRLSRDPDRTRRVMLGSLSHVEVAELARRAGVRLSRRQAERLRRHTDGHPLYVRTLLTELAPEQLAADGGELPAPRSLSSATVATLAKLPGDSRDLVSALAVLNQKTALSVTARVASVADAAPALDPVLATGFVRWSPSDEHTPIEFVHPLYRTAVYNDLSPTRRRDLHLAAASVLSWGPAWGHRVAAADSVDDVLADELDDGARYELARDDLALAAKYLAWAGPLTSSPERAEARLLEAARLLLVDGQIGSAAELRPQIEACSQTPLRDLVFGTLAFAQGDMATAEHFLRGVRDDDGVEDAAPGELADALGQLSTIWGLQGRADDAVEAASHALRLGQQSPHVDRRIWSALASGVGMREGPPAGLRALEKRLPIAAGEVEDTDADLLVTRGMLHMLAGQYEAASADLRTVVGFAQRGFSPAQLPRAHLYLALTLVFTGDWDEASAHARITQSLADDDGRVWMRAQAEGALVQVLAPRGEWDLAGEYVAQAQASARALGTSETVVLSRLAAAALARAQGQPDGVIAALRPLNEDGDSWALGTITARMWWPVLIAAHIDRGDLEVAAAQVARLEERADAWGIDVRAQLGGARARLLSAQGDLPAALVAFAEALAMAGPDDPVLERALLHHDHGRALLRGGNRKDARDELRTAHELFAGLGAEPYRQRAADDLVAAGVQANARSSRSPLSLTEREQDIVALVKKGMTNREVAAQIYVSEKAVEYHLRNVFGKLGISSRRELRDFD